MTVSISGEHRRTRTIYLRCAPRNKAGRDGLPYPAKVVVINEGGKDHVLPCLPPALSAELLITLVFQVFLQHSHAICRGTDRHNTKACQ